MPKVVSKSIANNVQELQSMIESMVRNSGMFGLHSKVSKTKVPNFLKDTNKRTSIHQRKNNRAGEMNIIKDRTNEYNTCILYGSESYTKGLASSKRIRTFEMYTCRQML